MLQIFTKKKKKGFTLIELLVVIAIIGVLSSVVLVSMGGARSKARDTARMSDMRQIITAQEMYYGDWETYLTAAAPTNGTAAIPGYLDALDDRKSTMHYKWLTNNGTISGCTTGEYFCAWAVLENDDTTIAGDITYFAASEKGTKKIGVIPTYGTNCLCW